jgi:hypothetical protein
MVPPCLWFLVVFALDIERTDVPVSVELRERGIANLEMLVRAHGGVHNIIDPRARRRGGVIPAGAPLSGEPMGARPRFGAGLSPVQKKSWAKGGQSAGVGYNAGRKQMI